MAKVKIINVVDHRARAFKPRDYSITKINFRADYHTKVKEDLPFRVRFTTIGVGQKYGPNNPAPIGIAVIGFNNYVL